MSKSSELEVSVLQTYYKSPLVFASICIATLFVAGGSAAFVHFARPFDKRVYVSNQDKYYYFSTYGARAQSLGITSDTQTFPESVALETGYMPVPSDLVNVVKGQEPLSARPASPDLASMPDTTDDDVLESARQVIRATILRIKTASGEPLRFSQFSGWSWTPTDSDSYRCDVLFDRYGDGTETEWWYVEILQRGAQWEVIATDTDAPEMFVARELDYSSQAIMESLERTSRAWAIAEYEARPKSSIYHQDSGKGRAQATLYRVLPGRCTENYRVQWTVRGPNPRDPHVQYIIEAEYRGSKWHKIEIVPAN